MKMAQNSDNCRISTNGRDGQHNVYVEHPDDTHEHKWYNSVTGRMGYHGENASAEDKWWIGQRALNG